MDGFLSMRSPGTSVAGLDFQYSVLHWYVSPARRRLLGVRRPLTRRPGFHLSLPLGSGLSGAYNPRSELLIPRAISAR